MRHGIERGFASFTTEGATYVQHALTGTGDFRSVYKGPYGGKHLDSIVTDAAKKTIIFHLKTRPPRPQLTPRHALLRRRAGQADTKEKYDKDPVSSGPYRIKAHSVDKSLTLVRNPHWDPKTDPIRNAYPDSFVFEFGPEGIRLDRPAHRGLRRRPVRGHSYDNVPPSASRRCSATPEPEDAAPSTAC